MRAEVRTFGAVVLFAAVVATGLAATPAAAGHGTERCTDHATVAIGLDTVYAAACGGVLPCSDTGSCIYDATIEVTGTGLLSGELIVGSTDIECGPVATPPATACTATEQVTVDRATDYRCHGDQVLGTAAADVSLACTFDPAGHT